ncbi:hypothetical protein EV426DRAFT_42064 [Tirmania nivea]|nr:hypothetical protein EV426DRAFT_42064 [Tirmania nivea]
MSDSNNRRGYGYGYGAQGGGYHDGNGRVGGGGQALPSNPGGGGFMRRCWPGSGINVTPPSATGPDVNSSSNHNCNNDDNNNKNNNKKNTGKGTDLRSSSNASGNRNSYAPNYATPVASSGQPSSQPPSVRKKLDYSKMQPTVEDVPDEDDRKSSVSGGSATDLETGTGTSNSSMSSGGGESQRDSTKQEQAEPLSPKKRKPVTVEIRTQPQNEPKKEAAKWTPTISREEQKRPVEPSRTPEQKADDIPELAPRKSMPYASTPSTGKPEEVARVPDHLNTASGSSKGDFEGRRSTPYTYTPTKKEPEDSGDFIKDRQRTPYATGSIKPEWTKMEAPDDPILTQPLRKPAPYSWTYHDKTPPYPTPASQKPGYRPSQESPSASPVTQRKPSQYSYIPQKQSASSENSGTPMKKQASKGRAEARSRPPTPGGNRTPKEYGGESGGGPDRRSHAPYAYSPKGSISSATSHKMQNSPSQGSYSQIPQNLQSAGNLRPTSSPAASYTSTGSAHGHYPHVTTSPQPVSYPTPHTPPPPVSTADGVYNPPYAPEPGEFSNMSHPQYHFPNQQSPMSYVPVATPMWITETDPGPPCPESTQIPWGTWYHPPYAPKFTICEGCYRKYISLTPFAPHFTRIDLPKLSISGNGAVIPQKTVLRACMFHSALTRQLWQNMCNAQAFQQQQNYNYQKSAEVFYAYAQRRAEMVTCAGPMGVKPPITREQHSQWPQWWACPNYLPNFLVCEACFVDYMDTTLCIPPDKAGSIPPAVCTSPYTQFFQPYTMDMYLRQNPTTTNGELPVWVCDVGSNMLIKHLLEEANKQPSPGMPQGNWDHFVRLAAWRLMDAKPCPGHQANEQSDQALVMGGGRRWYRCTKDLGKAHLVVCEACFYDMLVPANISHEFVEVWVSSHEIQPNCHLSMMEYRFPLSMAKETKDYNIFWDAAAWGLGLRKCDDRGYVLGNPIAVTAGVPGGVEWYVLFAGPDEDAGVLMECCPRCYHTFIKPSTFGDHFDRVLPGMILDRRNVSTGQSGPSTSTVLENTRLRICDLISFPQTRWQRIFFKLLEAAHQRDFAILRSWLWTSARLTPCARDGVVYKPFSVTMGTGGQRWYSTPGEEIEDTIIACEECYHGLIRETALEAFFNDITEGIIQHLSDPMAGREIVLLCSLYSQRQRELLHRCLLDLHRYPERSIDEVVTPLVQASTNRYREFIDIRDELQELEEERKASLQAQMAGLRLDNERSALSRPRDLEKRVADLHTRWKEIE